MGVSESGVGRGKKERRVQNEKGLNDEEEEGRYEKNK